jgi:hypothetical protein
VTEWHQLDPWDELQHESDMIWDCDQLMEYQTESESVVIDFASSDQTGVSCHTTSFNCREKQKLVAENIFIEGLTIPNTFKLKFPNILSIFFYRYQRYGCTSWI